MRIRVWDNGTWVARLEADPRSLRVLVRGVNEFDQDAVILMAKLEPRAPGWWIEVQDLGGKGGFDDRKQGIGIGHLLVNLAIEWANESFAGIDVTVSGSAFHGSNPKTDTAARRERFIERFGVALDKDGRFQAKLTELSPVRLPGDRGGLPGDLRLARLKPPPEPSRKVR